MELGEGYEDDRYCVRRHVFTNYVHKQTTCRVILEQKKRHEQFVSTYIEQNSHTSIETVPQSNQNLITATKQR